MRARALSYFFPLAFLLSWYTWYLRLFGVHTSGGMNPLGVLVAALIVAAACDGWKGTKALLLRIVKVRVAARWYLIALLLPVCFGLLAVALNLLLGAAFPHSSQWANWPVIAGGFAIQFLFVGLGEEPGWRGFAIPELQKRYTGIKAALLLGIVWALWHLPLMGTEFPWTVVPAFIVSVFAASVVLSWLFNSTGGSVLLCMLLHATVDALDAGYIFQLFQGSNLLRLWWIYTFVWIGGAAFIVWRVGPGLNGWPWASRPSPATDAPEPVT
jgi:membrane protease YdiL (CAAX protease family)